MSYFLLHPFQCAFYFSSAFPVKPNLAAMGLDYVDLGKQTGRMAAEVLKGEKKASELNFEVIETAAFYGNSKVAEDLGITFPEDLASNAKELFTEITQ